MRGLGSSQYSPKNTGGPEPLSPGFSLCLGSVREQTDTLKMAASNLLAFSHRGMMGGGPGARVRTAHLQL